MDHGTTPPSPPAPRVVQMEDDSRPVISIAKAWHCPPWCDGPPGHGFDDSASRLNDGTRHHEHRVWTCRTGSTQSASVFISQEEMLVAGGSGGVWRGSVRALVDIDSVALSGASTRVLAAALLDMADYVDHINAVEVAR